MDRHEFWTTDDDNAVLVEYLAQHSFGASMNARSGGFTVMFGDVDRVPPLPKSSTCVFCGTPLGHHGSAGWRHEAGFAARGGCTMPCPRPDA